MQFKKKCTQSFFLICFQYLKLEIAKLTVGKKYQLCFVASEASFCFLSRSLGIAECKLDRERYHWWNRFDYQLARHQKQKIYNQDRNTVKYLQGFFPDKTDKQLILSNFSVVEVFWIVHANSQSDILDAPGRALVWLFAVSHPSTARPELQNVKRFTRSKT